MSGKNGEGKGKFVNQAIKLSLAANVLFHLIAKNDIAAGSKLVAAKLHCLATNVRGRPINKFLNGIILYHFVSFQRIKNPRYVFCREFNSEYKV